jgi:hypothetical protein
MDRPPGVPNNDTLMGAMSESYRLWDSFDVPTMPWRMGLALDSGDHLDPDGGGSTFLELMIFRE